MLKRVDYAEDNGILFVVDSESDEDAIEQAIEANTEVGEYDDDEENEKMGHTENYDVVDLDSLEEMSRLLSIIGEGADVQYNGSVISISMY